MGGLVSQGGGIVNSHGRRTKREDAAGRVSVAGRPVGLIRQYSITSITRTLESSDLRFGDFFATDFL